MPGPDKLSAGLPIDCQAAILLTMPSAVPPETALNLGRNIQALREARGHTQQQISRIAGVPRATWANL